MQNNDTDHGDAPRTEPKGTSAPGAAVSLQQKSQAKPTQEHVEQKRTPTCSGRAVAGPRTL